MTLSSIESLVERSATQAQFATQTPRKTRLRNKEGT